MLYNCKLLLLLLFLSLLCARLYAWYWQKIILALREFSHTGQIYTTQSSLVRAMHIQDTVEGSSQERTGSASLRSS